MGCANQKEALEDQIMKMKLQRMSIQMEREKQLRYLSSIEGKQIDASDLPIYLASKGKFNNKNLNKRASKAENINNNQKNNSIANEQQLNENPLIHERNPTNGDQINDLNQENNSLNKNRNKANSNLNNAEGENGIHKIRKKRKKSTSRKNLKKKESAKDLSNNNVI